MTAPRKEFISALADLVELLQHDFSGMIIGGMAVIALGYPRTTTDIDATVLVDMADLEYFVKRLATCDIEPRMEQAIDFARAHHVLLMRHRSSGIDLDISLAMLPFELEAIQNRQTVEMEEVTLFVPRVEDLLIYKMVAFRHQDIRDVEELLMRYIDQVDIDRIRRVVAEFAEVLDNPDLVSQLEVLIKNAKILPDLQNPKELD